MRRAARPDRTNKWKAQPTLMTWSLLGRGFPCERLGHDLPILHHERIRPKLVAVVCRLGLPDDVGRVAIDVLSQHLEGHPRLREFRKEHHEELPDGTCPPRHTVRGEEP